MKKLAILAAVLMLVPAVAMAGMGVLNESSLNDVTGQVGITIDQSMSATIGFITWTDADGGGSYGSTGALVISNLRINDGGTGNAIDMTGLTIDVGVDSGTTALVIGMPDFAGDVSIEAVNLGGASLGSFTISDIDMGTSDIIIKAH